MKDKIFDIIKKYNITALELADENLSRTQISRMKNEQTKMKEKHYNFYINSINRVLKERGISIELNFNPDFFNSIKNKEHLNDIITRAIINKSIFTENKINEIKEMGQKFEIHSYLFRFLLANFYKKNNEMNKSLNLFKELFHNFENESFKSCIFINLIELYKDEEVEYFFNQNQLFFNSQNEKIKILIYYKLSLKYINLGFYTKAKKLLLKIIDFEIINNYYYLANTQIAICHKKLKNYKMAIHYFNMGVNDILDKKSIVKALGNTLSCYALMENEKELKKAIEKVLQLLESIDEKVYRINYQIAKVYGYLNDKEKIIHYLEKEIYEQNDFNSPEFNHDTFLGSIRCLMYLYTNEEKQVKMIKLFKEYPVKFINYKKILYLLKFYRVKGYFNCIDILIESVQIEFNKNEKR